MKKSKRINARVAQSTEQKLLEMVHATGSSMSDIIARAIESFYEQTSLSASHKPYDICREVGLIGCAEGSGHLSRDYKKLLAQDLTGKYGNR